jgi:hypothetical protein
MPRAPALAARAVQQLQELVGGEFDLLVSPLRSAIVASDDPGSMQASKVAIHECISAFRFVSRAFRESEMPLSILVPRMGIEEGVLRGSARLHVPPVTVEDVLSPCNQALRLLDCAIVDGVRGHRWVVTRQTSEQPRSDTAVTIGELRPLSGSHTHEVSGEANTFPGSRPKQVPRFARTEARPGDKPFGFGVSWPGREEHFCG